MGRLSFCGVYFNLLNERSERLRFRTGFSGDRHLSAQNFSSRQVTSVLLGTKAGGRLNGTISGELQLHGLTVPLIWSSLHTIGQKIHRFFMTNYILTGLHELERGNFRDLVRHWNNELTGAVAQSAAYRG